MSELTKEWSPEHCINGFSMFFPIKCHHEKYHTLLPFCKQQHIFEISASRLATNIYFHFSYLTLSLIYYTINAFLIFFRKCIAIKMLKLMRCIYRMQINCWILLHTLNQNLWQKLWVCRPGRWTHSKNDYSLSQSNALWTLSKMF